MKDMFLSDAVSICIEAGINANVVKSIDVGLPEWFDNFAKKCSSLVSIIALYGYAYTNLIEAWSITQIGRIS